MVSDVHKSKTRRDYLLSKVIEEFARVVISERIRNYFVSRTSWMVFLNGKNRSNLWVFGAKRDRFFDPMVKLWTRFLCDICSGQRECLDILEYCLICELNI